MFRCVRARANLRALITQKSCSALGMRNAILRNNNNNNNDNDNDNENDNDNDNNNNKRLNIAHMILKF